MILGYILESDSGGVKTGPVEQFSGVAGKFIDYHKGQNGETDGVIFEIDYGHGYGFNHGTELKTFHPGDSFSFTIEYTDTSDGTWENELINFSLKIFESDHELVFTITSRDILEKKEKLLRDAAFYRERTFTSVKMTRYYGREYTDALERADKGEPCAFCLLGQMFENSVYHAMENRDYEDPPQGYRAAAKIYYELAALSGYAKGAYHLGEIYRREQAYEQAEKWLLEAAEQDITDSYHSLGNLYEELWKQEHLEKYLQKALVWKQNALEAENSVEYCLNRANFYKEILINSEIDYPENRYALILKITEYYGKVAKAPGYWAKKSANEELEKMVCYLEQEGRTQYDLHGIDESGNEAGI